MGNREIRVDRNLRSFDVDKWSKTVKREKQADVQHDYKGENNLRTTNVEIPNLQRLSSHRVPVATDDAFQVLRQTSIATVEFADWDRDGNFDLLANVRSHFWAPKAAQAQLPQRRSTIFWLRNKTSTGEPEFDEPQPLYQTCGNIILQSFTIVDWNDDGANEIVVVAADADPKNKWGTLDKRLELLAKSKEDSKNR